jgi:hypothetical protein
MYVSSVRTKQRIIKKYFLIKKHIPFTLMLFGHEFFLSTIRRNIIQFDHLIVCYKQFVIPTFLNNYSL